MLQEADIEHELRYFTSEDQRLAFAKARVSQYEYEQGWQYGPENHVCTVVARNEYAQIVHCSSGFGPSFPWSFQEIGASDLGMDAEWHAYLYEAFLCSPLWLGEMPEDFELTEPGERSA